MRVYCTRCAEPREAHPGERVRCARCGALFEVPAAMPAPPQPAAPARLRAFGTPAEGLLLALRTLDSLAVIAALLTVPVLLASWGLRKAGLSHFWPLTAYLTFGLWEACALNLLWSAREAGRPLSASDALLAGAAQWPRALALSLLCAVRVAAYLLMLVLPGIGQAAGLAVALPAMVVERLGPGGAAPARSLALTAGQRGDMLWVLLLGVGLMALPRFLAGQALREAGVRVATLGPGGALAVAALDAAAGALGIAFISAVVYAAYRRLAGPATGAGTPPAPPPAGSPR